MSTPAAKASAWLAALALLALVGTLWWHWGPAIFIAGLGGWMC